MRLYQRKVKIVATLGPSTSTEEQIENAIRSGMNVARLNFSHGTHELHLKNIQTIRSLSKKLNAPVAILQDLQGPKIRVGQFKEGQIKLERDQIVRMTTENVVGDENLIPTDLLSLTDIVKPNFKVLLDDGLIELQVIKIDKPFVLLKVIYGGVLKNRKGINIPEAQLPIKSLTDKDLLDLDFGLSNQVDYVALSFVRHGRDIRTIKEIIEKKNSAAKVIAKIEMLEALDNIDEIIRLSDGVMVARGDLAVEVGQSRLPGIQKKIINLCNELNKPVITATQMLDSMVENPRPTRAEITDVANAVLDGSDALMLSAESASGKYPFKAIQTMNEIIFEVEKNEEKYYRLSLENEFLSIPSGIAASACLCALKLNAKAIVCLTTSGKTAQIISGFRPQVPIYAMTNQISVLNKLELVWGLQTLLINDYKTMDEILSQLDNMMMKFGIAKTGDRVILTLGQPIELGSKTNSLYVHTVSDCLVSKLENESLPLRFRS
ncbi:MAG: pyruvate kinase [Bdellovibrionaceae bacterium]|nr:pyruvate kinase [Pseudobdellovibrionaceae bacterium]NUM59474.1 pyruvate kinase [Pseudobdellovibrionaceae bacterium]